MRIDQVINSVPANAGDYRFAWIFSFLLAIVAAPFIVAFKHTAPWLIAVPLGVGTVVIFLYELRAAFHLGDSDLLEIFPPGFSGLTSYSQMLALEIQPRKKVPKEQLHLFPGFVDTTPANSIRILQDESGREIAIVNCDRYSALLVSYLLDNIDKVTDKSLRAGLSRFGKLGKGQSDIQIFVQDKTVREAVKSDFRGNILTLISKGGEKVVKDLLKTSEARLASEKGKTTLTLSSD
jgi:hypothetical protein